MADPAIEAAKRALMSDGPPRNALVSAAREALKPIRELHKCTTINCVICPLECEQHEDECPDDNPIEVCAHCWQNAECANSDYGQDDPIGSEVLWPCETARLVYSSEELGGA